MEQLIGLVGIITIVLDTVSESSDMVIGVVAYPMSRLYHLSVEVGIFSHVITHHEE